MHEKVNGRYYGVLSEWQSQTMFLYDLQASTVSFFRFVNHSLMDLIESLLTPCTFISLISWSKASTFQPCFPFPLNHESILLVLTKNIMECNSTTYLALRRSSLTAYHLIICLPCISTVWRSTKIFRHALD